MPYPRGILDRALKGVKQVLGVGNTLFIETYSEQHANWENKKFHAQHAEKQRQQHTKA